MGLLTGMVIMMSKYLIISVIMNLLASFFLLKMGEKWCFLVPCSTNFSKFSAIF